MMKSLFVALLILMASTIFAAASGQDVFYSKCTSCHGSALSLNKNKTEKQWLSTISRMTKHGLSISSSESKAVADFLSGGK